MSGLKEPKEIVFLYLYDSSSRQPVLPVDFKGLTCIDVVSKPDIKKKFESKQINLDKLPIFVISYAGKIKSYEYNEYNLNLIKENITKIFDF
jgi:hypothetical protein